jgi:DNA-binding CsgD family transcriptional regulator
VWEHNHKEDTLDIISHWVSADAPQRDVVSKTSPAGNLQDCLAQLKRNRVVHLPQDADLLSRQAKKIFRKENVKSSLMLPLFVKDDFYGILALEEYETLRNWSDHEVEMLMSAARIVTHAIEGCQEKDELISQLNHLVELVNKKNDEIDELRTTLSVLDDKREKDRVKLEEKVMRNLTELIKPAIDQLKNCGLSNRQKELIAVVEQNIEKITSPLANRLSSSKYGLTPAEIRVADFIKHGRRTKEIAELVGTSPRTVEVHRNRIREKIGLKNKKVNLRAFINSMESANGENNVEQLIS